MRVWVGRADKRRGDLSAWWVYSDIRSAKPPNQQLQVAVFLWRLSNLRVNPNAMLTVSWRGDGGDLGLQDTIGLELRFGRVGVLRDIKSAKNHDRFLSAKSSRRFVRWMIWMRYFFVDPKDTSTPTESVVSTTIEDLFDSQLPQR